MTEVKIPIVVTTWNEFAATVKTIESIISNTTLPFRLIIIDNNSTDGSREYFEKLQERYDDTIILYGKSTRDEGLNLGISIALLSDSQYMVLCANDIYCFEGWLTNMIDVMKEDSKIGICGPVHQIGGGLEPHLRKISFENTTVTWNPLPLAVNYLMFDVVLLRKEMVKEVGLMDEWINGLNDDGDYCFRANRLGWYVILVPTSLVWHWWGTTLPLGNSEAMSISMDQWRAKYSKPERKLYNFFKSVPPGSHKYYQPTPRELMKNSIIKQIKGDK